MKKLLLSLFAGLIIIVPSLDGHKPPKIRNENTGIIYTDLQTAIDDAVNSDILDIKGRCVGNFSIIRSLTLVGSEDAVLDGNQTGPVLDLTGNGTITITLDHLTITNGAAVNGGGINNITTLFIKHSKIYGNTAVSSGGALFNATTSDVSFGNGSVTVIESHIHDNTSSGNGGAFATTGGTLTIFQSKVSENEADNFGGGVYSIDSTTIITESKVESNRANQNGGGLYNDIVSNATLTQSKFEQNTANNGAGIFNNSALVINQSKLKENTASGNGGGIYNNSSGATILEYSKVIENNAANGGGIFNVIGGTVKKVKSKLEDNNPNNFIQG